MAKRYVGIDLGGTNIKAGVVDGDGNVLSKVSITTESQGGPDVVIARMNQAAEEALAQAKSTITDVSAIGIGAPGALNHKAGIIVSPPNLPGWKNVPVRDRISKHFAKPATLENDANVAAWGEFWIGAGKDANSLVLFTLGTGIGGGIVTEGKFARGFFDNAAEIGHMIVQAGGRRCNCGQFGCFEAYASAWHTAQIATEWIREGRPSSLKAVLDAGKEIDSALIVQHMQAGDALAHDIWQQTCRYIAIGAINSSHMVNPELVVLSGGMTYAGDVLLEPVRRYFRELRSPAFGEFYPQIVLAKLGNDAGFIGAAGAAKLAEELGELS